MAAKKRKAKKRKPAKKKRPAKRRPAKKRKTAKKKSSTGKKKACGGYSISFNGCKDSLEKVFGAKGLGPSDMTKKLWVYIKRKKLGKK